MSNLELKQELEKLYQENKYSDDIYSYPISISVATYEYLLKNHNLNLRWFFESIAISEPGEKHDQLFDLALSNKVNFSRVDPNKLVKLSDQDLGKCLRHGLWVEDLAKRSLEPLRNGYDPENVENNTAQLSPEQIKLFKEVDISEIFADFMNEAIIYINGMMKPYVFPEKILEALIKDCALDVNLVLAYGVHNKIIDIVKLALANGADVNYKEPDEDLIVSSIALNSQNIEMVDLLIEHGAKLEFNIEHYVGLIKISNFEFIVQIISKFPNLYSTEQLYEIWRAYGSSEAEIRDFLDLHDLIHEYNEAKAGKSTSISQLEMDILDGNISSDNIIEYKDAPLTNKYGYGLLHLTILGNQYGSASKLVKDGIDIHAKTYNNITALQLLSGKEDHNLKELAETILDRIDNLDVYIGSGETLTDILIQNKELEEKVIELTADPLFSLFKKDADLFSPTKDLSKTYIAISHGDDFWSTGIWSAARIIGKNYPNVQIHLVRDDMINQGGEEFIKQFDAVINPGAGDSYPKLAEFTKADCPFSMDLEKHYQNMLELTEQHNIPYLGMCAGAQHFSMYHGGALKPLKGYNKGGHEVKYIEGTYAHFMALTKIQQEELLKTCEFPEVKFKGDTAHNYAAINEKLGNNIELGAVSEDNVAMSYAHSNGIRYATQFHPEHYYNNLDDSNTVNQKAWINNFVELAQMHHEFRINGGEHPAAVLSDIKEKLMECITTPVCAGEDSLGSYYELYHQ